MSRCWKITSSASEQRLHWCKSRSKPSLFLRSTRAPGAGGEGRAQPFPLGEGAQRVLLGPPAPTPVLRSWEWSCWHLQLLFQGLRERLRETGLWCCELLEPWGVLISVMLKGAFCNGLLEINGS